MRPARDAGWPGLGRREKDLKAAGSGRRIGRATNGQWQDHHSSRRIMMRNLVYSLEAVQLQVGVDLILVSNLKYVVAIEFSIGWLPMHMFGHQLDQP